VKAQQQRALLTTMPIATMLTVATYIADVTNVRCYYEK
jgi:hypothetical protein